MLTMRSSIATALLSGGLCSSDAVDDEPNTALGDDVRDAISHLDVHYRLGPMEAEHGEDVHDGVCQPAHHCDPLSTEDQVAHPWVSLGGGGCGQAHQELVNDVAEGNHGPM